MKKYNRADKILFLAAILFIIALYSKIQYPDNVFIQGFLFCMEAALVGGIADWFAVKALFSQPLGISWHTAILPRKRQTFTQATTKLVQQQFFSRKNIFLRLRSLNAVDKIIDWADKDDNKKNAVDKIMTVIRSEIEALDLDKFADNYTAIIEKNINVDDIDKILSQWMKKPQFQQQFLKKILTAAGEKLALKESRIYIEKILADKMKSNVSSFLFSLGSMFDVINTAECAALVQNKLIVFLQDMMQDESQLHSEISAVIADNIDTFVQGEAYSDVVAQLQKDILAADVIKKSFLLWGENIRREVSLNEEESLLQKKLQIFINEQIDKLFILLRENTYLHNQLEKFINDIIGRSALQGQSMIGDIVQRVLMNMSDKQLNEIVYSKISTDLIWIRVNGSIVGGGIGLLIFLGTQIFK